MAQNETSTKVKVGALVLFSVALLVAFVVILGDFSLSDEFTFYVDFDNAGGLKPGADVAISGINAGNIKELAFHPNKNPSETSAPNQPAVEVRATIEIDHKYADAVRRSSQFFVSRRGVLGEPYIEVETTSFEAPPIAEGAVMRGAQPPRMDVIVSKATDLLDKLNDLLDDPNNKSSDLIANTASLMDHLDAVIVGNREELDGTIKGARVSAQQAADLLSALNVAVGDGKALRATLADSRATAAHARSISQEVDSGIGPLFENVRTATASARRVGESLGRLLGDNEDQIGESLANLHETTAHVKDASKRADALVSRVASGHGTVGQLLTDRQMYDDMKELLRTIKRRPWKIIWKE